jgi:hypothetical protein
LSQRLPVPAKGALFRRRLALELSVVSNFGISGTPYFFAARRPEERRNISANNTAPSMPSFPWLFPASDRRLAGGAMGVKINVEPSGTALFASGGINRRQVRQE